MMAVIETDLEDPASFLCGRNHLLSFEVIPAGRFLTQDVLAVLQGGNRYRHEGFVGCSHHNRFDIVAVDDIHPIAGASASHLPGCRSKPCLVYVGNHDQLVLRRLSHNLCATFPDQSATDNANLHVKPNP
jgi:hypothetical protein